jgi:thiol:disulfide interchange protein DsbD
MAKGLILLSGAALACLALLTSLAPLSSAQTSDDIITVTVLSSVDKFQPGSSHRIALEIRIQDRYHINSEHPAEDYLVPTSMKLSGPEGATFGKLIFPSPLVKTLSFSETPLEVYEGTVWIFTDITLPRSLDKTEFAISGTIEYQACDDKACLAPAELSFSQTFPVARPGETVSPANAKIFAGAEPMTTQALASADEPAEGAFTEAVEERGLFLTFAFIFLGGLALNLTPCVYPLIPITIGYFGGQAQGRRGGVVSHAILYVLGMAITYSVLGVIAALTGSLFGAALQNPIVLIVVAAVMVALALSMFNLYEFRLPSFLTRLAGGSQKGYPGTLLMGLTVGLVAAPCIGPFVLGLLTYVGGRGQVLLGFFMFFVLALGLGLPFLFLAIFSGSLDRLPRSGVWMVWVRTIFGFVLLGMAVYFLKPLFPNALAYSLTLALILFVGGIYMAWIEPTKTAGKAFPAVRLIVGILFFAAALVLASRGIQGYIQESVREAQLAASAGGSAGGSSSAAGPAATAWVQWASYSDKSLARAAAESKPALLDFYADWCIPCKELDKLTFSQPEIIEKSLKFVMLKVDLTSSMNPDAGRLKKKYQIKGVPTLVFLSPDGSEVTAQRIVGFVKKEKLLSHMEQVLAFSAPK